ncbi:uncharacterized protein LOC123505715 [Portunus trituberculatus]|uniref:UPAR/Ly6 domain-containing protein n=1 Tax=Portunus trituberculatus TaxID=210409 RepID=A0A5B7EJT0_PORTR|nr:uncharacterized protein LOC123505715 [Portunus trituberculatus]MPC33313.1 hypothetical protein [Portunus trituberculatus]
MMSGHLFIKCFLLATCILGVLGQKCYVCKDQEENTGKCTTTVEPCDYGEEYCLSEIKWGSTPYWEIGAPMQYFISKRCATKDDCVQTMTKYMPNCLRIWWKDWTCAECCKGDRCNYYITLGSSSLRSSLVLVGVAGFLSIIIQRMIY